MTELLVTLREIVADSMPLYLRLPQHMKNAFYRPFQLDRSITMTYKVLKSRGLIQANLLQASRILSNGVSRSRARRMIIQSLLSGSMNGSATIAAQTTFSAGHTMNNEQSRKLKVEMLKGGVN